MALHAIHNNQLLTTQDAHRFLDSTLLSGTISNRQCNEFIDYVSNMKYIDDEDTISYNEGHTQQPLDDHNIDYNIDNTVQFETGYMKTKRLQNLPQEARRTQRFEDEFSQIYGPSKSDKAVMKTNHIHHNDVTYIDQPWGPYPGKKIIQQKRKKVIWLTKV